MKKINLRKVEDRIFVGFNGFKASLFLQNPTTGAVSFSLTMISVVVLRNFSGNRLLQVSHVGEKMFVFKLGV